MSYYYWNKLVHNNLDTIFLFDRNKKDFDKKYYWNIFKFWKQNSKAKNIADWLDYGFAIKNNTFFEIDEIVKFIDKKVNTRIKYLREHASHKLELFCDADNKTQKYAVVTKYNQPLKFSQFINGVLTIGYFCQLEAMRESLFIAKRIMVQNKIKYLYLTLYISNQYLLYCNRFKHKNFFLTKIANSNNIYLDIQLTENNLASKWCKHDSFMKFNNQLDFSNILEKINLKNN